MTGLKRKLGDQARALGFELFGIASAGDPELPAAVAHYDAWLADGNAATMEYLTRHRDSKADPSVLLPGFRSVVCVALCYGARDGEDRAAGAKVSLYTRGRDYHDVMSEKLEVLCGWLERECGARSRAFVDSSPVLDRFWASRAGLGWVGKNTCLINRKAGSYLFLGGLLTTADFNADMPYTDHCGRCRKCIEACPTGAIREPVHPGGRHFIESQKCIAYHTIENRGAIPEEVSAKMDTWIAGCDICQQACPWNDPVHEGKAFTRDNSAYGASLLELARWSREDFQRRLRGIAMSRMKYEGFVRNIAIALANCESTSMSYISKKIPKNSTVS